MSDLFSSLLIFTIIKTILCTFFFTVSKFKKKRNWPHRRRKRKQEYNTIYVGHHYAQTNINNVDKT